MTAARRAPNATLTEPQKPRQERSQQTVRRILEATLRLLERDGVEALTTNRIAGEAELSVASLYQFFPNKQAVIYAAYSAWIEELQERIAAVAGLWRPLLRAEPASWPQAAGAIADVLGEGRRTPRVEYELLRAMYSHRELRARDRRHTSELAAIVADMMRDAGAIAPEAELRTLAAYANEQFTLATELGGDQADGPAGYYPLARLAFLDLWRRALPNVAPERK